MKNKNTTTKKIYPTRFLTRAALYEGIPRKNQSQPIFTLQSTQRSSLFSLQTW